MTKFILGAITVVGVSVICGFLLSEVEQQAFGCGTLGNCVPKCGDFDGDCAIENEASVGEACGWFREHPAKEHTFYTFSEAYHCWGVGGTLQGGLDSSHCRPGGLGGFAGIQAGTLNSQIKGHMAHACGDASGVPARILAAAQGDREAVLAEQCGDWRSWSVWAHPSMGKYVDSLRGIPGQDDVPAACHVLQPGPG